VKFNLIIRSLSAVFLILGIYLLISVLTAAPEKIEESILLFKGNGENLAEVKELSAKVAAAELDEPLVYYTGPVKEKNLFTAAGEQTQAVSTPSFKEKISSLNLQGIISGDSPQAVIVDKKSKQTYFLSAGEYIGEIEVKEILPGRVRLNYLGQETELAL
jgi:hypothetical protein